VAYIPELVLAWISVVQACAFFVNRETATKAMDIVTLVADEDTKWVRVMFQTHGRLKELVDALAVVGRAMLVLGEHEGKSKGAKKRGWKGESLRIWDVNVRN
jgi:nuclear pore complex protein Nup107